MDEIELNQISWEMDTEVINILDDLKSKGYQGVIAITKESKTTPDIVYVAGGNTDITNENIWDKLDALKLDKIKEGELRKGLN